MAAKPRQVLSVKVLKNSPMRARKRKGEKASQSNNGGGHTQSDSLREWCGHTVVHARSRCRAHGKKSNSCGKMGHFAVVCMSIKDQSSKLPPGSGGSKCNQQMITPALEEVFLGEVTTQEVLSEP